MDQLKKYSIRLTCRALRYSFCGWLCETLTLVVDALTVLVLMFMYIGFSTCGLHEQPRGEGSRQDVTPELSGVVFEWDAASSPYSVSHIEAGFT